MWRVHPRNVPRIDWAGTRAMRLNSVFSSRRPAFPPEVVPFPTPEWRGCSRSLRDQGSLHQWNCCIPAETAPKFTGVWGGGGCRSAFNVRTSAFNYRPDHARSHYDLLTFSGDLQSCHCIGSSSFICLDIGYDVALYTRARGDDTSVSQKPIDQ